MVFRSKKGQSALEFLMTYGWAFLVALVVIGGLAYFGVLDPLSWLPSRCKFGAGEIACDAFNVDVSDTDVPTADDGLITLKLKNSIGKTVKIASITAYTDQMNDVCLQADGDTDFGPLSEIMNTDEGTGRDELDPDNTNDLGALIWSEGDTIIVQLDTCEFGAQTVQANKKQRFYVDIKYYPKLDGIAFSKTVRGEVFTNVEE